MIARDHRAMRVAAMLLRSAPRIPTQEQERMHMMMIRRITLILGAGLMAASAATAQAPLKPVASVEGITEYRLANGLQVLLAPDSSKPSTTVNMTYKVGSRHENYGETGMAHLLEHLLFKPTAKNPAPDAEFAKRGLQSNGSTWLDRTNYFASFAANEANLRWYLEWQADIMVNSRVARSDLDTEMTVVRNEMEMGENDPGNIVFERLLATMYQWHNYGKSTIGARADVENVDIPRLQAFYRQYYQPDNATLIVSGKFDSAKVLAWVQQSFGKIKKPTRKLPKLYTLDPVQDGERFVAVRRTGGVASATLAYHVPPGPHPDYAAVELLNLILTEAPAGRLHKALVERDKLAASVAAFAAPLHDPGFTVLNAELAPGASLELMSQRLLQVVEQELMAQPITAEELKRAQTRWLNRWEQLFTDPEQVGTALSETVSQGDWRLFFLLRDRIRSAKLDDVQRVARERLLPSNRTLAHYIPTDKPQRAPAPAMVEVAAEMKQFVPAAAATQVAAFDASPANIDRQTQRATLASGLQLALLPKPTRGNAVQGVLSLRWGDAAGLQGLRAVSDATAALLDKGTQRLDRQQLRDRLDALKVELQVMPGSEGVSVAWTTRREHAAEALALIGEMLRQPRLGPDSLDEVRAQSLAALQAQRDEPQAVAANAIALAFNGPYTRGDVRHARTFDEIAADTQAVSIEQVRAFHARFYGASQAQLGLVGDFDAAALKQAAETAFGDWRAPAPYARVPRPSLAVPGKLQLIQTPDKQNAVLAGRMPLALSDEHADYPALLMANYLLGEGSDSRLWKRIREKEGLSYGVWSFVQWSPLDENSPWNLGAIFAPSNRSKVETALREEVARALKDGFSAEEVAAGKQALLSSRALARAQDPALAQTLAANLLLKRTLARSQQVDEALSRLTPEQVNAALRKYLKLADFQLIFAGDFKQP
ncbi:pitrilysin family protein [Kinneretia asaccharophila]|uniref:Zinc protease n=2 Tax=Roseateles asaccharophilus TaxID=582607 RepID=A0A4R6NEB6_9BURK|nr:pitrilysin family protein [Roseateles asaccharophilus]MDN3545060.1 pitrilysin family protein [Roseateles asaccharophilus]TDP12554.1 zinc protease [Roseateles asaccharophilus]